MSTIFEMLSSACASAARNCWQVSLVSNARVCIASVGRGCPRHIFAHVKIIFRNNRSELVGEVKQVFAFAVSSRERLEEYKISQRIFSNS